MADVSLDRIEKAFNHENTIFLNDDQDLSMISGVLFKKYIADWFKENGMNVERVIIELRRSANNETSSITHHRAIGIKFENKKDLTLFKMTWM